MKEQIKSYLYALKMGVNDCQTCGVHSSFQVMKHISIGLYLCI